MSTIFTNLSSFFIDNSNLDKLQDDFEKLREFSENDFIFMIQDKINSTLAKVENCLEIDNVCSEMCTHMCGRTCKYVFTLTHAKPLALSNTRKETLYRKCSLNSLAPTQY